MKISTNNLLKTYTELLSPTKDKAGSHKISDSEHHFDAITIQSNPREIAEHTFSETLSKKLSSELSVPASQEYLQQLREQVNSHSYQADAMTIAAKILLIGEA